MILCDHLFSAPRSGALQNHLKSNLILILPPNPPISTHSLFTFTSTFTNAFHLPPSTTRSAGQRVTFSRKN